MENGTFDHSLCSGPCNRKRGELSQHPIIVFKWSQKYFVIFRCIPKDSHLAKHAIDGMLESTYKFGPANAV